MNRFRQFAYKVSQNHTRTCWVLKCDIKKFFASIDQSVLLGIVRGYIPDKDIRVLIAEVVSSFTNWTSDVQFVPKGLPLGNLTSQLLVNIYMNEFDQFMKHKLKAKYYIRYADDFVILSADKRHLLKIVRYIALFLRERLQLELHPNKVSIHTVASGINFLGWVHFPDHRVLRTGTKRRMLKRLDATDNEKVASSYLGLLSHGNTKKLRQRIESKLEISVKV